MLFARLSGASVFTAAKKNAVSYGDSLTKAGGSAAKAAKEIRDATTGIDELNIIMQKNDDAGGGGGGGADYGSMFEELPIDNSVSEFADKLKQAFESADWKALGTIIGDKVNEVIDGVNWTGVGQKIGYWINAGVQTAYWFLDTVNFTNIGKHIAELINGGLEQVDFTYVGRIVVKWFTLILDMVIGFFTELDWGLVAKSVSDFFIGAFNEAIDWLNKYDWGELGSILWQKFKDAISNIDLKKRASTPLTARANCSSPSCPHWRRKKAAAFPKTSLGDSARASPMAKCICRTNASSATKRARTDGLRLSKAKQGL